MKPKIESPCTKVCKVVDGHCIGCGRTIQQITNWTKYTQEERKEIAAQLQGR